MSYEDFNEGRIGKDILRMSVSLIYSDKTGRTVKLVDAELHSASSTAEDLNALVKDLQDKYSEWKSNTQEYKNVGVTHRDLVYRSRVHIVLMTYEHQYISTSMNFIAVPSWKFFIKNLFFQMMEK